MRSTLLFVLCVFIIGGFGNCYYAFVTAWRSANLAEVVL